MSVDVRPEYLNTDDDKWFFDSGEVPNFNTSTSALGEMFDLTDVREDGPLDSSGFVDAQQVLDGLRIVLASPNLNTFLRERLIQLRQVATWAAEHGRRVEWA